MFGRHKAQAQQLNTPMGQALEVAPDCRIINSRGKLTFKNGPYNYELSRQGKLVIYTVSDGVKSIAKPILYCFGQGHVGQTYLFRHNNALYETRVSYFERIRKLDFTIGHQPAVPTSLDDALGRAIGGEEPQQCFGCHTTGAVHGLELKLDQLNPGVGCEACHGPGEKHLVAAKEKKLDGLEIFNPAVSTKQCVTCHMPKVDLPGMHASFTDHWIRIARPGGPVPR